MVSLNSEVVIKDACILFDLMDMGLLGSFYKLRLNVITTPEVVAEILDEVQLAEIATYIKSGELQIDDFGELETIISILESNPGLSVTDASVLAAATRRRAIILSSDKSLRNESTRRGLTVKGMLWILEEMYNQKIFDIDMLLQKLELYYLINKRAPKTEIDKLVLKLSKL